MSYSVDAALEYYLYEWLESQFDIPKGTCIECKERFSDKNVYSSAGAKETQISGLCEQCFDKITVEE